MPQFEVGQRELVDLHHYTYEMDLHCMLGGRDRALTATVQEVAKTIVAQRYQGEEKEAEDPNGPCDACDGPHATSKCPHYKTQVTKEGGLHRTQSRRVAPNDGG